MKNGSARSSPPATHNGAVPLRILVRAALAAVCAAGCTVCVLTYASRTQLKDAFAAYIAQVSRQPRAGGETARRPFEITVRKLRDSDSALNPNVLRETGIAISLLHLGRAAESERTMVRAARREPNNVNAWATLAQVQVARNRLAQARRSYARARELDPHLPPGLPPAA
jgi:Flp pilus assembly protein TadD